MTASETRPARPLVIRHEAGWPWQWLLAGTVAVAAGLIVGLPEISRPPLQIVPTAAAARAIVPAPAAPAAPSQPAASPPRQAAPVGDVARIEVGEAARLLDEPGVVVIDARDRQSFAAGHLPGAINVTPFDAPGYARRADLSRLILVYCE